MTSEIIEPDSATLPPAPIGWESATFPQLYEKAREALAACESIDECLEWHNKSAAMASYFRQAKDRSLEGMAQRIRLRAWRRCGELFLTMDLKEEIEGALGTSTGPKASTIAGRTVGLNRAKINEAIRLAKLSSGDFEKAISAAPVPSISQLASPSRGGKIELDEFQKNRIVVKEFSETVARLIQLINEKPDGFEFGKHAIGWLYSGARHVSFSDDIGKILIWLKKVHRGTKRYIDEYYQ